MGGAGPGPAGDGCPYPANSLEEEINCTLRRGARGLVGPSRGVEAVILPFTTFEEKRYELISAWYEFHWWRLYELLVRTSVPHLVSSTARINDDSLEGLLRADFERARVEAVTTRWLRSFIEPLRSDREYAKATGSKGTPRIEIVLSQAEPFVQALTRAGKRGTFIKEDLELLKKSIVETTKMRSRMVHVAIDQCNKYAVQVLGSPEYQNNLALLITYFEVPVCGWKDDFVSSEKPEGVESKIVVATAYDAMVSFPVPDGVTLEEAVPADLLQADTWRTSIKEAYAPAASWLNFALGVLLPQAEAQTFAPFTVIAVPVRPNRFRPSQIIEFLPSREVATVVGSLGLHVGFQMPKREDITLSNLEDYLRALSTFLKRSAR